MKQLVLLILLLSSVLWILSAFASGTAPAPDAVLDTDGNELKRGNKYYILQSPGIGGGLGISGRNETLCPLYVAKESSEVELGVPVRFYPVDAADNTVRLSTDTNFMFSAITICIQSNVWRLRGPSEATGRLYVSIDGVLGNPGVETLSNWFKIEKLEDGSNTYKLVFCPGVCDFCRPICGDLGLFLEDGTAWLGLFGSPLSVAFKKASVGSMQVSSS